MITTEDEAKTKWCPEVRTGFEGDENRDCEWDGSSGKPVPPHYACIASACMAWRWRTWIDNHGDEQDILDGATGKPTGYCGKAGKP